VSFVVEEMKAVFDPRGGAWSMANTSLPSSRDRRCIERHMIGYRLPAGRPAVTKRALQL